MLFRLGEAHLVEQAGPDRYRMHDLLRAYARELAEDEPGTDVQDAVRRLVGFYLHSAEAAGDRIHPGRNRNPIAVNEADGL